MKGAYIKVSFGESTAHIHTPVLSDPPQDPPLEIETVCSTVEETNAAVLSYILENFPPPMAPPVILPNA